MERTEIFRRISEERERQEKLRAAGRFKVTNASAEATDGDRIRILGEEFGEVCGASLQEESLAIDRVGADLQKELIHMAAVTVAWLESL